jgi:preprotein translocase subunit SecF
MWIIKHRTIFYVFSLILIIASVFSFFKWGLNFGIDFTGGTLIEVGYSQRPDQTLLQEQLVALDDSATVRPSGTNGYLIKMKPVDQAEKAKVMDILKINESASTTLKAELKTFDSIGPILGKEALRKAMVSIVLVIVGIVLFITFAFRKVSEPVSSWKYGLVAIVALVHDVIIPTGAFSILGHFYGYEIDTLFVTAILVILGFSVHGFFLCLL